MTRTSVLRGGYGTLAVAFAAMGASIIAPTLILGLGLALIAAALLVFSDDDIPRWGGLTIVAFLVVIVLAFVLANPISFSHNGHYYIEPVSPQLAQALFDTLSSFSPVILAGAALAASWERETPVRILMVGGAVGLLLVEVVTLVSGSSQAQASLLTALFALSALATAIGAGWSAARPEEYA